MNEDEDRKTGFTLLEKIAIAVIVVLVIIIVLLIFNEEIKEYIEIFKEWYEGNKT
jgi:competence protein ComGC